jgi:hypothetical protein
MDIFAQLNTPRTTTFSGAAGALAVDHHDHVQQ